MRNTCWIEAPNRNSRGGLSSTSYSNEAGFFRGWRASSESARRTSASKRPRTDKGIRFEYPSDTIFQSLDVNGITERAEQRRIPEIAREYKRKYVAAI